MQKLTLIQTIAVWIIPVLLAVTLHEAAHAWVANRCGDNTAKMLGRLSINPFRHIDLIGTLVVPIFVAILSDFQFVFGWAKPVPINWYQLHNPRRDMAMVAAAGPVSNLLMAFIWASMLKTGLLLHPDKSVIAQFMVLTGYAGVLINLALAFLNLIPVPPLDGSRIITSMLSPKLAGYYLKLEPVGFLILFVLLFTGVLSRLIQVPIAGFIHLIYLIFNIG